VLMAEVVFDKGWGGRSAVNDTVVVVLFLFPVFYSVPCPFVEEESDDLNARFDHADRQGHAPTAAQQISNGYRDGHVHDAVA